MSRLAHQRIPRSGDDVGNIRLNGAYRDFNILLSLCSSLGNIESRRYTLWSSPRNPKLWILCCIAWVPTNLNNACRYSHYDCEHRLLKRLCLGSRFIIYTLNRARVCIKISLMCPKAVAVSRGLSLYIWHLELWVCRACISPTVVYTSGQCVILRLSTAWWVSYQKSTLNLVYIIGKQGRHCWA